MSRNKYSIEFKIEIAKAYIEGKGSYHSLAHKYKVCHRLVRDWTQKYLNHGESAFYKKAGNACYSSEFKIMCVEKVLSGIGSVDDIVAKYNISGRSVLLSWISKYNANRILKDYDPKREVYMAEARRKTTIEERKEIVEYCLKHNRDYKGTASIYDVSYNQVYSWVKKYDANGEEGLSDKRGHRKADNELDELERLKRENLRLKRLLQEKDMTVELLKKVKEFERM